VKGQRARALAPPCHRRLSRPTEVLVIARAAPDVKSQPRVEIAYWRVFEFERAWRLCGLVVATGKLRRTTGIVVFDARTRTVRTASGRFYLLIGPPATTAEAAALRLLLGMTDAVDVTNGIAGEFTTQLLH